MIEPNLNNSYKTKKNFTGSYTEVNPYFFFYYKITPGLVTSRPSLRRQQASEVLLDKACSKSRSH